MTTGDHHSPPAGSASDGTPYRAAATGAGIAGVAAVLGRTMGRDPESPLAAATAIAGVVGMLVAGYAVSRRPKDSVPLGLAALTALLGGLATNPAWDAIAVMQW